MIISGLVFLIHSVILGLTFGKLVRDERLLELNMYSDLYSSIENGVVLFLPIFLIASASGNLLWHYIINSMKMMWFYNENDKFFECGYVLDEDNEFYFVKKTTGRPYLLSKTCVKKIESVDWSE